MITERRPLIEMNDPQRRERRLLDFLRFVCPWSRNKKILQNDCLKVPQNHKLLWCLAWLAFLPLSGCGYTVGNSFSRDIKTVAVPIFENKTNRRGLEFQLTEAVQKEITKRTTYRLAKGLDADTRLTGEIVSFRKDVLGETRFDDPRELQLSLMVKVTWEDLRSGQVLAQEEIPISPEAIPMTAQSEFSPEVGESLATGLNDVFQSMALKIVNLMEVPW
jgi:hypothetical protein